MDFTASWCGPCKMIGPYFEELAGKFPGVVFVKVDVDDLDDVAAECGISAMPTFQLYSNGVKVEELTARTRASSRRSPRPRTTCERRVPVRVSRGATPGPSVAT